MTARDHHRPRHLRLVPPLPGPDNPRGDVAVISQDDHTRLILHGPVDYRIADELEEAASFCLDGRRRVIADVRHLESIDSVGLSIIVRIGSGLREQHTHLLLQGPCRAWPSSLPSWALPTSFAGFPGNPSRHRRPVRKGPGPSGRAGATDCLRCAVVSDRAQQNVDRGGDDLVIRDLAVHQRGVEQRP